MADTKKKKRLTTKERLLVKAKVQGKTDIEAGRIAGYSPNGKDLTVKAAVGEVKRRPHVQEAIDAALSKLDLSVEWAVGELGKVAAQDEEMGAKRLATKDILELHGWNKKDKPTVQVEIKGDFFANFRKNSNDIVEGEIIDEHQ